MTRIEECDAYDCKFNSWQYVSKKNPGMAGFKRNHCLRLFVNVSDGRCGNYTKVGR